MKHFAIVAIALVCAGAAQAAEAPPANPNVSYPWRDTPARDWGSPGPSVPNVSYPWRDSAPRPFENPASVANWQGFYVGGFGGWLGQSNDPAIAGWSRASGPFGGGTIGWQGQWQQLVAGVEADIGWGDVRSSVGAATSRVSDLGTLRGRVGYAFNQVLLYGTGGYAWAYNTVKILGTSTSHGHSGWTAGAGVEVMFAPQWSVKAEYLYRWFESQTYVGLATGEVRANTVQVGVNFHF